jgi:phosphatidylinositol alpha-1,6-mannosyltransferase
MSGTPKVLVLTPDFPPAFGGIQLVMDRLVRNWGRVRPRVVTLDVPGSAAFDARSGISIVRTHRPKWIGRSRVIALLNARAAAEALRFRPDVVLCGHINVSPAAVAIAKTLRAPYVQYLHGREVVIRPRLARIGIRCARSVVAVSRYTADLALAHGAKPDRLHRIPPGVDVVEPDGLPHYERPTVVCVARLEQRYKGHDVLIRAMGLVRSRFRDARLVVVGDGFMRPAYGNLALALGLDGAVEFTGSVADEERNRILEQSHVFAMPSRLPADGGGEGFGIVYLEAGLRGTPVVAGNVAGALDAVVHGETGLLVDPEDHVAVADAICELLSDPARAAALGRAGARRAREHAWPAIARHVEDLLLRVAA